MSSWETIPAIEVQRVCSYITDDSTIASYFQLSRDEVAQIRASIKPVARNHSSEPSYGGLRASSGLEQERALTENAIAGSNRLKEAIHNLFARWERKHGFQEGAAEILLPAGYRP